MIWFSPASVWWNVVDDDDDEPVKLFKTRKDIRSCKSK